MSYQEFCIDLDYFNVSYPSMIEDITEIPKVYEAEPRDKSIIYRGRENKYSNGENSGIGRPYNTISEISIVPETDKHNVKFGRCNKPREPRFYASNGPIAACLECLTEGFTRGLSDNRGITLGSWKIIEPLTVARVNYSVESLNTFYQSNPKLYDVMLNYARAFNNDTLKKIAAGGERDTEFADRILGLFADEFAKIDIVHDLHYTILNYYCDNIFDRISPENPNELIDGILYPSVSSAYQEMNIVLHPRAMRKIKFLGASLYWLTHHADNGEIKFIPIEQNVTASADSVLQWKRFKKSK